MIRAVTIAALLAASVAVGHAEDVAITSVDDCNRTVTTLEGLISGSLVAARALDQAKTALAQLKAACAAGDLDGASKTATDARAILAVE